MELVAQTLLKFPPLGLVLRGEYYRSFVPSPHRIPELSALIPRRHEFAPSYSTQKRPQSTGDIYISSSAIQSKEVAASALSRMPDQVRASNPIS